MTTKRQQQWQSILQMTQQMRQLAIPNESLTDLSVDEEFASQPWQDISDIESSRLALIKDFFSQPVLENDAQEIAEGIRQMQSIDNDLFIISKNIQKETAKVFSSLGNAQRAVSAYSDNVNS